MRGKDRSPRQRWLCVALLGAMSMGVSTFSSCTSPCYYGLCLGDNTVPWSAAWPDYGYPPAASSPNPAQYPRPDRLFDLTILDPATQLAPNFVASEVMQSWKGRYGISQPHAIVHLQNIRNVIGGPITVTSGYRSPDYNAGVGGATYSRHMYGDAFDFSSSAASLSTLSTRCSAEGADFIQLYTSHIHCDWRNSALDAGFYSGKREPAGTVGVPEVVSAELVRTLDGWTAPALGFDEGEPLRVWTARDAAGEVLDSATGAIYGPPAGTVTLEVTVGGMLDLADTVD